MNIETYAEFLEKSECERFEYLTRNKLNWWQKLHFKIVNKWWTFITKENQHLRAIDLWESIYKGRY